MVKLLEVIDPITFIVEFPEEKKIFVATVQLHKVFIGQNATVKQLNAMKNYVNAKLIKASSFKMIGKEWLECGKIAVDIMLDKEDLKTVLMAEGLILPQNREYSKEELSKIDKKLFESL